MQTSALFNSVMTPEKKKVDIERNYSDETFYTDSSEDVRSKCKSAANLLQKRRQLRPINGSGNPYRSNTRLASFTSPSKSNVSMITQKIMSAKLLRVKQLQNELTDAQFQLNELSTENRILRTLQKRQDMALKKYEGTQAELPQLIRSHTEEVRTLKAKLKQAKVQCRELENHLKMRETELSALQEQHKHLLKLSKDKHLGEREQLQLQLEQMQELLKEQDKKVQMLSRKVMLEGKNYKHHLTAEVARHKRTTKELDIALDRIAQLESILEAKEKYIAVNLTRSLGHQPASTMSLVPHSRIQLYQTPSQTATSRNSSLKQIPYADLKQIAYADLKKVKAGAGCKEEGKRAPGGGPPRAPPRAQLPPRRHADGEDDEDDEGDEDDEDDGDQDTDEDYQQPLLSESLETQSFTSQNTNSRSLENISKSSKDVNKERGETHNFSSKVQSEFGASANQGPDLGGAARTSSKFSKTSALRRFSLSGDSHAVAESRFAENSRRGSLSDTADAKEEFAFGNGLISELGKKAALQKNALEKYVSFGPGAPGDQPRTVAALASTPAPTQAPTLALAPTQSQSPLEAPPLTTQFPKALYGTESACGEVEGAAAATAMAPCHVTAEEGQLQLQAINCTWDEIQGRIRDETTRAQSIIEKYDEEQRSVDEHIGNQTTPDAYDKNHLLAALRAIEDGGDPVDLNTTVAEKRSQLSLSTSTNVEYRNVPQVVENIHSRGIPIHTSSSVSAIERPQMEHSNFWENSTLVTPGFLNNERERPRTKSDIMHNYFGSEKY